jgi:hypothetical protein
MSIETAMAALNTPATVSEPAAPVQQQAITPKEAAAATVEAEAKAKTVEAPKVEEKPVETVKTADTPKTSEVSAKFSALAKKEKAIVEQSRANKAAESKLAEREAAIAARESKIKESEALWDTDVFKALELRGYDYNKLTMMQLEGKTAVPETDPVKIAKKTIDDFKKEQADAKQAAEEASKKAATVAKQKEEADLKAAWDSYNSEVTQFVEENKDTYELINTYAQQALIAETVDAFYQKNKRVLSVKEASDMVEAYLESEAEKALNTKKIGGKVKVTTAAAKKEEEPRITKTLNNNMQPTSASVLPAQSEADRMRRAMAALESES